MERCRNGIKQLSEDQKIHLHLNQRQSKHGVWAYQSQKRSRHILPKWKI